MKTIYLLCLHNVRTGGPEAIHQLSDSLLKQGFDARMVYYNRGHIARLEGGPIDEEGYHFSDAPEYMRCQFDDYAHYATRIESAVPNSPDAIVVLPEAICHLAPKFNQAQVLIWWLSVDNAFGALSRVNLNHLRAENVDNAWQSYYAQNLIGALQLRNIGPLMDYTPWAKGPFVPDDKYDNGEDGAREPLVVFNANPRKVVFDIDEVIARLKAIRPSVMCCKLDGTVAREDVKGLLGRARVYVDLGNFPGNDRLPREAAWMRAQILVTDVGAAAFTKTYGYVARIGVHASPSQIAEQIAAMLEDRDGRPAAPTMPSLYCERETFFAQARAVFERYSMRSVLHV